MIIFQNISHGEEDDNPGAGVVVLAVGVHQADGVEQGRVEGPHICELCRLKSLAISSFKYKDRADHLFILSP